MNILESFKEIEVSLNKAELSYRLTGEIEQLLLCEKKASEFLGNQNVYNDIMLKLNTEIDEDVNLQYKVIHQKAIKYQGNKKLMLQIEKEEKLFRGIRKNISNSEYEVRLRELVKLRNKYAKSVGYVSYLELQYDILGIDKYLLTQKIDDEFKNIYEKYNKYISLVDKPNIQIKNESLECSNQISLAEKTLKELGINLKDFSINFDLEPSDKKVSVGAVVPLRIPNDIHVVNNPVPSLGGFACILMHEIGHAIYFSSIDESLPYALRNSYNSMMDEGVALFFENLVFSEEWFNKFLNMEYPKYNVKECFTIPQQICSMKFEMDIYNSPEESFDEIWKLNSEKYLYDYQYNWTQPHFFISAPAYFSAYLSGELFARTLKDFLIDSYGSPFNNETGKFIVERVFKPGKKLDLNDLLKKIEFTK